MHVQGGIDVSIRLYFGFELAYQYRNLSDQMSHMIFTTNFQPPFALSQLRLDSREASLLLIHGSFGEKTAGLTDNRRRGCKVFVVWYVDNDHGDHDPIRSLHQCGRKFPRKGRENFH